MAKPNSRGASAHCMNVRTRSVQEDHRGIALITVNVVEDPGDPGVVDSDKFAHEELWSISVVMQAGTRRFICRHMFAPCKSCVSKVNRLRQELRQNLKACVKNVCSANAYCGIDVRMCD